MKHVIRFIVGLLVLSVFPLCGYVGVHFFGPEGAWLAFTPMLLPAILFMIYGVGLLILEGESNE